MFERYIPKKFCRDFVEVKGSSKQLVMFMSVALGIKPAMDDWIFKKDLAAFKRICWRYGLLIKPDVAFSSIDARALKQSVGGETLTTTIASGIQLDKAKHSDLIHVFISKTKDKLDDCFKNGWYPVVIKGRTIQKPYIDLQKFGYNLGYPACCIKFFRHFNDWYKYSHLFEIYKNTQGQPSALCNCLTKDVIYSYIYHMPCSFDCKQTKKIVHKLREAIKEQEPDFVSKIDAHLRIPFLVFYETVMYAFEGSIKEQKLYYRRVYFIARGEGYNNIYQKIIEKGNCLFLENEEVYILKNKKLIGKIKPPKTEFAPQKPFLIQFY